MRCITDMLDRGQADASLPEADPVSRRPASSTACILSRGPFNCAEPEVVDPATL